MRGYRAHNCRMWEHSVDMKKEAEGCSIEGAT
jgi:hypothetical protein